VRQKYTVARLGERKKKTWVLLIGRLGELYHHNATHLDEKIKRQIL
jgi:hypothetical protein